MSKAQRRESSCLGILKEFERERESERERERDRDREIERKKERKKLDSSQGALTGTRASNRGQQQLADF